MTFRSGPSAARRLLQPPQPASTPTRPPDPRLTQPERALARSARRPRFRVARGPHQHARPKPRVTMTAPASNTGGDASPASRRPCGRARRSMIGRDGWDRTLPTARTATSRVFTGQGRPSCRGPPHLRTSPLQVTAKRVFPQPDPLGHLSSWKPRPHWMETPALLGTARSGCSSDDSTEGCIARSSAKRTGIRSTRGAFHR